MNSESGDALRDIIKHMILRKIENDNSIDIDSYIEDLKNITTNCNDFIVTTYKKLLETYGKLLEKNFGKEIIDKIKVAKKINQTILDGKKDEKGIMCYTYNGKKYYFIDASGAAADTSYKREQNPDRDFKNNFLDSLEILKELDITKYEEILHHDDIIKSYSPKEPDYRGYNNKSLYYAVYADFDVKKDIKSSGGKRISKGNIKKVAKKPVVYQKKQSVYK